MEKSYHYLSMLCHSTLNKRLFERLENRNLTLGQPKILEYLLYNDGSIQKDISRACKIEQATVTSVLGKMETAGLIERKYKDGNRRSLYVYLTEKGREEAENIVKIFLELEDKAFKNFNTEDKDKFIEMLNMVYDNLK